MGRVRVQIKPQSTLPCIAAAASDGDEWTKLRSDPIPDENVRIVTRGMTLLAPGISDGGTEERWKDLGSWKLSSVLFRSKRIPLAWLGFTSEGDLIA